MSDNDYEGIRRTHAQFCTLLDERRFAEWAEVFAVDGSFGQMKSRAVILDHISGAELATVPELNRKHTTHNLVIDLDGDRAHVESDLVMFDKYGDEPWKITTGKYTDEMVRQDGRWYFATRNLVFIAES